MLTTPDSVQVKARWAPMTSLFSRLTSAPVRVRVKKATGMRCTWPNTARRRSRMRPSPILDDCQRSATPTTASTRATRAISTASPITRLSLLPSMIASTTCAGQHRGGDRQDGGDDAEQEEGPEGAPVGPGELADAAQGGATEGSSRLVALHGALQRHPMTETHLHAAHLHTSSALEVKAGRPAAFGTP